MLTDPSYAGQIVMPTYPLMGNYGISERGFESRHVQVAGFVVREHSTRPSHADSTMTLDEFLKSQGIPGISGLDTRSITRRLRSRGVMMGVIAHGESPDDALARLQDLPSYGEVDFVERVSASEPYDWDKPGSPWQVQDRRRRLWSEIQHPADSSRQGMRGDRGPLNHYSPGRTGPGARRRPSLPRPRRPGASGLRRRDRRTAHRQGPGHGDMPGKPGPRAGVRRRATTS